MSEYGGNMWYKCDFHLHTMTSKCYKNQEDTPKAWVDRCLEQGLSAVAVTDHNDYRGIDEIMREGEASGLAVFPGVEICCDTSKIHMLVIFDTCEDADTVRDFLSRCDIGKNKVGDPDGTNMDVFTVCKIAKSQGALVIAAHIDEFNSINGMNPANLDSILDRKYIDAVQVTNLPIWRKYSEDKNAEAMQETLRSKYGKDATNEEIERWRKCYERAKSANLPMLSFSDNPASDTESKHGLWGIGNVYTWIQMDSKVNLESIRQSLVSADSRIRMIFDSEDEPKLEPYFWIKSIEIRKTTNCSPKNLHIDFHPQLNCIIGGCGSGKSAIIQILSGVYQQITSAAPGESYQRQMEFYNSDEGRGIFTDESEIEICFKWFGIEYRMLVSNILNQEQQVYRLFYRDEASGEEIEEATDRHGLKSLMSPRVYINKQIYEITQSPSGFIDLIDSSLHDMYIWKKKKQLLEDMLITSAMDIHSLEEITADHGRLTRERDWLGSEDNSISEILSDERLKELITTRAFVLEEIENHVRTLEEIRSERASLIEEYEKTLENIRSKRMAFIDANMKDDENYKLELIPFADKNSFAGKVRSILLSDYYSIDADIKKLEDLVFGKKVRYELAPAIFTQIRNGNSAEIKVNGGKVIFSDYFVHLVKKLSEYDFNRLLLVRPEDELLVSYHPNGVKRFFTLTTSSTGARSASVLAFVLNEGVKPLVIDSPEGSIDSHVICEEIIPKIKRVKSKRQMIIATNNANIAMNSDAEMIISMATRKKFIDVGMQGSVDDSKIRKQMCDTLEGTENAFKYRVSKYYAGEVTL